MKKLLGLLLIVLTIGASSQITTPISQLPTAGTLSGSELVPVVQSGVTKKTTVQNIVSRVDSAYLSVILSAYLKKTDTVSFYEFANQMLRIIDTIGKWQQQGKYMVDFGQPNDSTVKFRFSDSTDKDLTLRIAMTAENIIAIQNINTYLDSLRGPDSTQLIKDLAYSHLDIYATYDSVGHIDTLHYSLDTVTTTHGGTLTAAQYTALLAAAGGGTVLAVTGTSPINSSGGTNPVISINNAAADGSTKGAASFTANDFNSSSGNISIDYTNGQAADGSTKGFLTAGDWSTFNNKEPALGNPASNGYILSSTAGGTRSWVAPSTGGNDSAYLNVEAVTGGFSLIRDNGDADTVLINGGSIIDSTALSDSLKAYASYGSITTDNVVFSTPVALAVTNHFMSGTFALKSQSSYTLFGRASGSGAPSFLASIDSNWIPALHTEGYYNTKYIGVGGAVTSVTGTANRITSTGGTTPVVDIGTDVVTLTGSQTLTNKTLTQPVINSSSSSDTTTYKPLGVSSGGVTAAFTYWPGSGGGGLTGSGVSNRVAYYSGTSSLTSDASFGFNPSGVTSGTGKIVGLSVKPTVLAQANGDTIVGLDLTPFLNINGKSAVVKSTMKINNSYLSMDSLFNFSITNGRTARPTAGQTFFYGTDAGFGATGAHDAMFVGQNAGLNASAAVGSLFLIVNSGSGATNATFSNFLGFGAGQNATNAANSNFFGQAAGQTSPAATFANFIGYGTGGSSSNGSYGNYLGYQTGQATLNGSFSNFFGYQTGKGSRGAHDANFIGSSNGAGIKGGNYTVLIGYHVAMDSLTGQNNIIIGNNITAATSSISNSLNIGNVLYGTGFHIDTFNILPSFNTSTPEVGGKIGISTGSPNSTLHFNGSLAGAYVAKTANYTATESDYTIECTANTFTVTAPTAVGITGREYWVTNTGSGTITLGTTSSQTFVNVTGTPTTLSIPQFSSYRIVSNNANWLAYKIVN